MFSEEKPRIVYCEVHMNHDILPSEVTSILESAGFDVEVLIEQMRGGKQQYLKATR